MKITSYLFPFNEVAKGSKIIIYGGGIVGRQYARQITALNYCECLFITDKHFSKEQEICGIAMRDPAEIERCVFDKIVIATKKFNEEVYNGLIAMNILPERISRTLTPITLESNPLQTPDPHNGTSWDDYYEYAEEGARSQFHNHFEPILTRYTDIDLSHVLDFACGRGRIAQQFTDIANHITCCDVNSTAIEFCKERFRGVERCGFSFLHNENPQGGLGGIPAADRSFSFAYSWDAMVHFSYKWIDFYMKEFYRILRDNAYLVIHHSNLGTATGDETSHNWYDHPHGRTPLSQRDVAFIADNHGFTVMEQKIIDWPGEQNLDCISVLKKA